MKKLTYKKLEEKKNELEVLAKYLFIATLFLIVCFIVVIIVPSYEERQSKQENRELREQIGLKEVEPKMDKYYYLQCNNCTYYYED